MQKYYNELIAIWLATLLSIIIMIYLQQKF